MKNSKNNYEIQILAEQVSDMRRIEMNEIDKMVKENEGALRLKLKWEKEKEAYETDIKNLRETNSHLENQLKFQAQVNSELKTLLVAAVGEDLESRVQHLTEDKLALARALLNSANHLTSHQEQTEWLSGQCEVWRSKFLASSLMVEELAKWKSALSKGINDLKCVTKTLLEEHHKVNTQSLKTYCYLKAILEKLTGESTSVTLKYRNIMEIMAANQELVNELQRRLDVPDNAINQNYKENKTIHSSVAARRAEKMVCSPLTSTYIQDALCNAVMGAANSMATHQQVFSNVQHCCAHCKGDIQDI